MVPQPVIAVMFLYPISKKTIELYDKIINDNKEHKKNSLFFVKQTIGNACGTMAMLHSILNNLKVCEPNHDGILYKYYQSALDKTPEERAELLEKDEEILNSHEEFANDEKVEVDMDTNNHFICFVENEGYVYLMDGRQKEPILCCKSTGSLLFDCIPILQQIIDCDPTSLQYSISVLAKTQDF